jgi:hypothetical protein
VEIRKWRTFFSVHRFHPAPGIAVSAETGRCNTFARGGNTNETRSSNSSTNIRPEISTIPLDLTFSRWRGHSIGHSKQKESVYARVLFRKVSETSISLYSSRIVDKEEILRIVSNNGIYCSRDKAGTVYLV